MTKMTKETSIDEETQSVQQSRLRPQEVIWAAAGKPVRALGYELSYPVLLLNLNLNFPFEYVREIVCTAQENHLQRYLIPS